MKKASGRRWPRRRCRRICASYVPDPAGPDAYPIATFTWILLRKNYADPAKAQALRDLFAWSLGDGQHYASDLGYVPLPPEVAEKPRPPCKPSNPDLRRRRPEGRRTPNSREGKKLIPVREDEKST